MDRKSLTASAGGRNGRATGMRLEQVEAVCAPGGPERPNDDAYAATAAFAVVLDGATGLGGQLLDAPSDAAWLARCGAEILARLSGRLSGDALLHAAVAELETAFVAARARPPAEMYEMPMASLLMVQPAGAGAMTARWFGDCSGLVQRPGESVEVIGDSLDHRANEAAGAAALASRHGVTPAGNIQHPEFLSALRTRRNRHNGGGGLWCLAPQAACAGHAYASSFAAPPGTWLLLMTDGFAALATDHAAYDAQTLAEAARTVGLQALLDELRAFEDADPEGRRRPRFKKSDDATALLLRVEA